MKKRACNFKIINSINDDILKQLILLDSAVYLKEDCGVFETCKNWLSVNSDIYTVLLNDNEVVGYINFMPITNECYNKFLTGEYKDYNITNKDIVKFSKTELNNCLFTSIVIKEKFRTGVAVKTLLNGFIQKINLLNKDGYKINNVVMDCVTNLGEKMAVKLFKAKPILTTETGKIYEVNLLKKELCL